jgi:hypothetical protein
MQDRPQGAPGLPPGVAKDRRKGERRRYLRRACDRLAALLAADSDPIYKGDYFRERRGSALDRRQAERRTLIGNA